MLTLAANDVNDGRATAPAGLWLTLGELAEARGVSKPAISQNLKRWADAGAPVATRKHGRELLVNAAEYDARKGDVGDLGRELGEQTKKGEISRDPVYTREQARAKGYEADLKFIERERALARLVEVEALQGATVSCAEAMVRAIDQSIVMRADEMAAAVAKNGVAGARTTLKAIAREVRTRLADELAKLSTSAMAGTPAAPDASGEEG